MGHIVKTPASTYRANWRDHGGRQRSKTFRTKAEARAFLAEITGSLRRGTYVDPHAGRITFGVYATRWLAARNDEATTAARDVSIMRNHVISRWGAIPLGKIDHLAVQTWVSELSGRLAPATIAECHRLTSAVLRAAVRDRLIGANPCDGVKIPRRRRKDTDIRTITRAELVDQLLPALHGRHRALVGLAGGTGLRWGECVGLRWDSLDLDAGLVHVVRVAVEVAGHVTTKAYPKSKAGRRSVPLPAFVITLLRAHRRHYPPGPAGEVFTNTAGGPMRRTHFRARDWRPALVRAGLLGKVTPTGPRTYVAEWRDATGRGRSAEFDTEREAIVHAAKHAAGGLRFHDLRHSYATWLVSDRVPINDIVAIMGHENASTTLNLYTHRPDDRDQLIRDVFDDFSLSFSPVATGVQVEEPSEEGS